MFDPWLEYGISRKSKHSKDRKFYKIRKRIAKQKRKFAGYQIEIFMLKARILMKSLLIKELERNLTIDKRKRWKTVYKT